MQYRLSPMQSLKPTVKRDLCLISIETWKKGYDAWNIPVTFFFDGARVHFYHLQLDFDRLKTEITPSIIRDEALFTAKNNRFLLDIAALKDFDLHPWTLQKCTDLIGSIMSFYIFVVSDKFVEAKPEAWESRKASESILYEVDEATRKMIARFLSVLGYDQRWARVLRIDEAVKMFKTYRLRNRNEIAERLEMYILYKNEIVTGKKFDEFCKENEWENPETPSLLSSSSPSLRLVERLGRGREIVEAQGSVAFPGSVTGKVVIVRNGEDCKNVQTGDILIATMTNITWLPAMLRCAAIVTDEGGITCHAAITARELQKPCITGTKNATSIFKNGDIVELNTETGKITLNIQ